MRAGRGDDAREPAPAAGVYRRLAAFALLSALFVAASVAFRDRLDVAHIRDLARGLGAWGPVLLGAAGIVTPLLFLPRWPIAVAAGLLYGVVGGTVLANVASTLGAWAHFLLARSLLAPAAQRALRRWRLDRVALPRERMFVALLFLRAFPLSNFVATNLLAGSLRVPVRTYLAASFLGMIPSSLMYAAWGKMVRAPSKGFYAVAALSLAFIVAGTVVAQRRFVPWLRGRRRAEAAGEDAA